MNLNESTIKDSGTGEAPITAEQAAAQLNGNEYTKEGSLVLFAAMRKAGLVAVYGGSDDNMEMRGAILDEIYCFNGGFAWVDNSGLLRNECEDDCPYFKSKRKMAAEIEALWDVDGLAWRYKTEIPHVKFTINEEGKPWCEGIVFALADVKAKGEV